VIKGDVTFVESGALRLWTERFGDPGDPVVLLIMGTSAQGIGWPDELVETLVNGGRQVVRFDHRDTGQSDCVDFAADPYTLSDMAADALAVLNGQDVAAAHIAGASLGGRIGQLLAVHHPSRVLTLTAIMTSPMGHDGGPAWARALAGQPADPGDLPPPAPQFLQHLAWRAGAPSASRDERIAANVETWRVLNAEALPFDAAAARRFVEASYDRERDHWAPLHHDLAGRQMTADRLAPVSAISAPTLVIHGTDDPLVPPAHGRALAALVPGARFAPIPGMGHGFFSPGLPSRIGQLILQHTVPKLTSTA
jgi:pimeloyl-ACP methyl ester carboxylesterase